MDQQRQRIQEDLRGLIAGEVRCDDVFCQLYASDASIYQVRPLGVVLPRSTADVAACLRYCHEHRLPVHPRGAGTGLAGESLGPGIVLDCSKHLRRVLYVGPDTVRIQPGVVHERLNSQLRRVGRHFGPDPAMGQVSTLGGVIAVDSGGSHWLRYGSARRHVISLQVVLADGEVLELGNERVARPGLQETPTRRQDLVSQLATLLERNQSLLRAKQPQSAVNRCGYQLADVLVNGHLNLAKVLSGSAGTLAVITEATLATQPYPRHRAVAMLFFDRLESAARAALEMTSLNPSACDILDRRHLALAREHSTEYQQLLPSDAEAMLLVECDGDNPAEVRSQLHEIVDRIRRRKKLAYDARMAFAEHEVRLFWRLALKVVPTLFRLKGSARAIPFVEDLAVPPAALPRFLAEMQNIFKTHQVTATLFGHAAHGQLHVRPFLDLGNPDEVRKMPLLANDLYQAVWEAGGTIAGEHGDGFSRTQFIRRQYGEAYEVFREVKRIFDPLNILNPGKVISDEPDLLTRNLRPRDLRTTLPAADAPAEDLPSPRVFELQLAWTPQELAHAAQSCNGCGACRAEGPDVRMCPIFRMAPAEEASPRAKANIVRGLLSGELPPETIASDLLKDVADLCVNCQMCRLECPAHVDIPKLMIETKAAYVREKGLSFSDIVLTRLDLVGAVGCKFHWLVNWAIRNRQARWLLEKLLGVAQGRKLPTFAARTFLHRAARRRLTRPSRRFGRKVLYFADNYVNFHDPQLGEALVAVLEHNGVSVYVHPGQQQSGMAMIALGSLDSARKVARQNVRLLAEAVRLGYTVVATEPSAVLCLTREYCNLLDDDDDARLVADNTVEGCTYLWRLHTAGDLQLDFKPVHASLAYHMPCHLKALYGESAGMRLLRLVPGLTVSALENGCSGMAGTFGLKRDNYRASLRAGWPLISALRQCDEQAGTTECSACKIQMEQGSSKPTVHPIKVLALAYGLMPEVGPLLTTQGEELVVT